MPGELSLEHFRKSKKPAAKPVVIDAIPITVEPPSYDQCRSRDVEVEQSPVLIPKAQPKVTLPSYIRQLKLVNVETRAQFMQELTRTIPLNDYELPAYLYRADLVDIALVKDLAAKSDPTEQDVARLKTMMEVAQIPINYHHGFPTFQDGKPIWSKLPFETQEAYDAFLFYCEQSGARTLQTNVSLPLEILSDYFHLNFWHYRAIACDAFRVAHHARLREQRIMTLEGEHWAESEKIFKRIAKAIEGKTDEELGALELPALVKTLDTVAKLQRTSVGLTASGGQAPELKSTPVELTMRTITGGGVETKKQEGEDDFSDLYNDPDMLQQAQELILKIGK